MQSGATVFEFTSYKFEPQKKRVLFSYKTEFKDKDPLFFTETIILPQIPNLSRLPKELITKLLEGLHIVLGISYYKFYCATKVRLPYALSKQEADFWNTVYKKGLGEFFYKNKLNPNVSIKFPYNKKVKTVSYSIKKYNKSLVGIGGGKDSIVSAELLKKQGFDITAFNIETGKSSELVNNVIKNLGVESLKIQRFLDRQVSHPHQYNGHIPISAIYAFLGIFTAALYHYDYFIVSNEHSSNFGNITYRGMGVNHQWSKSFEFETLFSDYLKNIITPDVKYISLLRPFYEIRIAKIFSSYKKYFPYFSSCNKNFTINNTQQKKLWCGQCAKCVFAFILLSAFLPKKELLEIFGQNLYEKELLLPLFKDVLGFGKMKPFDCVGTFNEAKVALHLASKKHKESFIVRQFATKLNAGNKIIEEVFGYYNATNIPKQFLFLGVEKALILGYGKEGQVTKKYLKKHYPDIKIGVADEKQGKDYLDKIKNYDIVIKTPGIPKEKLIKIRAPISMGARPSTKKFSALAPGIKKELVKIPYTTATNIFFSNILHKNTIIGVTGSKGKSTTSSLIYHILKTAGKKVELLGNIGKPMLLQLLKPVNKNTIFVLELSSYQLDDIAFSPDIAVVTNLFPEHLNYHGTLKNYYEGKKNIINFQNQNNFFVYDGGNKKMANWLKNYKGKLIPFSKNILLKDSENPLKGEHNKNNIKAAISTAKILDISKEVIKKAIKSFKALPHRLEFIGDFKGITFYDDGSSTNPESAILAIKALKNVDTIFIGGQERGFVFSDLEKTIKKYRISNVVLFPDNGDKMIKNKRGLNVLKTKSMKEAVAFAYKHTKKGKICLLSGASPSYSLWKNFEQKGNQFKLEVKKYK